MKSSLCRVTRPHGACSRVFAAASLAIGIMAAPLAGAHAIWFAQHANRLSFIFGLGADDLDTVKRLHGVTHVSGYDADGKPVPTTLKVDGPLVVVDSARPLTVVSAAMFYGLWSKLPNGEWVGKGRDEVPNSTESEKNYKYAVHLIGPLSAPLPSLPHQVLQLVPVSASLPALKGEPLKLRVLFRGKPIAGVEVLRDFVNDPDGHPVTSGADGTVTLLVRNQGLNVISATYDGPPDDPKKVDRIEYEATLSFVLPHKPE